MWLLAAFGLLAGFLIGWKCGAAWERLQTFGPKRHTGEIDPTPAWVQLREHPDVAAMRGEDREQAV